MGDLLSVSSERAIFSQKGVKRAVGGVALTLALMGGAELHNSPPAEAQSASESEQPPLECVYGEEPVWVKDRNGDGKPGPDPSEFSCLTIDGCRTVSFMPGFVTSRLYEMGEMTYAQARVVAATYINQCKGDSIPSPEDYQDTLDADPWIMEVIDRNDWIGPAIRDYVAESPHLVAEPWAVMYNEDTSTQEPDTTSTETDQEADDTTPVVTPESETTDVEDSSDKSQEANEDTSTQEPDTTSTETDQEADDTTPVVTPESETTDVEDSSDKSQEANEDTSTQEPDTTSTETDQEADDTTPVVTPESETTDVEDSSDKSQEANEDTSTQEPDTTSTETDQEADDTTPVVTPESETTDVEDSSDKSQEANEDTSTQEPDTTSTETDQEADDTTPVVTPESETTDVEDSSDKSQEANEDTSTQEPDTTSTETDQEADDTTPVVTLITGATILSLGATAIWAIARRRRKARRR